jgi:hypothetical protein
VLDHPKRKPVLAKSILFVLHALQFTRMVVSMLSSLISTIFFAELGTPPKAFGFIDQVSANGVVGLAVDHSIH